MTTVHVVEAGTSGNPGVTVSTTASLHRQCVTQGTELHNPPTPMFDDGGTESHDAPAPILDNGSTESHRTPTPIANNGGTELYNAPTPISNDEGTEVYNAPKPVLDNGCPEPRDVPAPIFSSLPSHLLSLIAAHCKGATKKSLRATCRSCWEATPPTALVFPPCTPDEQPHYTQTCQRLARLYPTVATVRIVQPLMSDTVEVAEMEDAFVTLAEYLPRWGGMKTVELPWSLNLVRALQLNIGVRSLTIPTSLIHHPGYTYSDQVGSFAAACLKEMATFSSLVELDITVGGSYEGLEQQYSALGTLTRLKKLRVCTFMATGREPAYGIMNMSTLSMAVETLTALTELCLDTKALIRSDTQFGCQALANLKSFTWRCLHLALVLPVACLANLTACTGLTKLVCEDVMRQPEVLEYMPRLAHLDLGSKALDTSNASGYLLRHCTALKVLRICSLVVDSAASTTASLPCLLELHCSAIDSELPLSHLAPNLRDLVQYRYQPASASTTPCRAAGEHKNIDSIFLYIDAVLEDPAVLQALSAITSLRSLSVCQVPKVVEERPTPDIHRPSLHAIKCLCLQLDYKKHRLWSVSRDIAPLLQLCPGVEVLKLWFPVCVDDLSLAVVDSFDPRNVRDLDVWMTKQQEARRVEQSIVALAGEICKLKVLKRVEMDVLLLVRKELYRTEGNVWRGIGGQGWLTSLPELLQLVPNVPLERDARDVACRAEGSRDAGGSRGEEGFSDAERAHSVDRTSHPDAGNITPGTSALDDVGKAAGARIAREISNAGNAAGTSGPGGVRDVDRVRNAGEISNAHGAYHTAGTTSSGGTSHADCARNADEIWNAHGASNTAGTSVSGGISHADCARNADEISNALYHAHGACHTAGTSSSGDISHADCAQNADETSDAHRGLCDGSTGAESMELSLTVANLLRDVAVHNGHTALNRYLTNFVLGLVGCPSLQQLVLKVGGRESFEDIRYHKSGKLRCAWREAVELQVEAAKKQQNLGFDIILE